MVPYGIPGAIVIGNGIGEQPQSIGPVGIGIGEQPQSIGPVGIGIMVGIVVGWGIVGTAAGIIFIGGCRLSSRHS
ncbi:hypothetical protein B1no1_13890 [Thermolongibacillus altinsuensis]|nr:hypothetical protein B1no1_13890 [Thermolongibacillus altinsuensis]